METSTLLIGLIIGLILGATLLYFILKSAHISRSIFDELNNNFIKINADLHHSNTKKEELITINSHLNLEIKKLQDEKHNLLVTKSQISAQNDNLHYLLNIQKEEITKMQELAKNEFQNLANKILEEKTEKFTLLNQNNLKNIL